MTQNIFTKIITRLKSGGKTLFTKTNKDTLQSANTSLREINLDINVLNEMNSIKWWHRIEITPGLFTPGMVYHGVDGSNFEEKRFGIPSSLIGKSVIDIGGWDGFFSFACEKRGASNIMLIDVPPEKGGNWGGTVGFNFAKKMLKSKVEFHQNSVNDDLTHLGKFDISLFYGVLYHLPNLIPALQNTFNITKEYTLLETAILRRDLDTNPESPIAGFFHGYDNDPTNYWYPNITCLKQLLKFVGYSKIEIIYDDGMRATIKAIV